ncbi:MAG: TRAP transporter large permease subunit [Nanoarchaeota archaeon]|nr:TRAP transporter large permease subunit [Nanoarchaeota archaeon]
MDPHTLELMTAIIFVITYAFIVKFYQKKVWVIWGGVILVLLLGSVSTSSAYSSINWDVIGIYVGMLFIAEALIHSKMPDYLAIWLVNRSKRVWVAMLFVCALTGILSIVIENVACVLIVAPIAFAIAKRIRVSPVPMIIGCAISSNLQGVATLIGDPPSMLLAGHAGLTFNDFFFFQGKPNLFFAVQLGMIASLFVLYFFFRHFRHQTHEFREVKIKSMFPTIVLFAMIAALALTSSFRNGIKYSAGATCMFFGVACLLWLINEGRKNEKHLLHTIMRFDWGTVFFIIAVFIMVDALTRTGVIADIAKGIYSITGTNVLFTFVTLVVLSMAMSAFIDNVPYIVAMLPVTQIIAENAAVSPFVLYFGLLIGASVGGNITPVGASANIVGVGLLKNRGYQTTFWEFVKMGLPFSVFSVLVSAGYIWLMYGV